MDGSDAAPEVEVHGSTAAERLYLNAANQPTEAPKPKGEVLSDDELELRIRRLSDYQVALGLGLAVRVRSEDQLEQFAAHVTGGTTDQKRDIHEALGPLRRALPIVERGLSDEAREDPDSLEARKVLHQILGADVMSARPIDVVLARLVLEERHAVIREGVGALTRDLLQHMLSRDRARAAGILQDVVPPQAPPAPRGPGRPRRAA